MDVPHPIIGKGKNVDFKKHRQRQQIQILQLTYEILNKKIPPKKEMLKTLLEVQLPCWSQPLAPMGPGKFFSPRGGAAG